VERAPVHASHLPERVGLFTIIVLGETVVAVVIGTSTVEWSLKSGIVAALGFVLAAGFWWIYFDYLDGETLVGRSIRAGQAYFYSHLPLTAGIVALGVGVEHAIEETSGTELHDGTRWLLCGGLALAFVSLAIIHRIAADARRDVDVWLRLGVVGVALAVALLGGGLGPTAAMSLLAAAVAACLAIELALSATRTTSRSQLPTRRCRRAAAPRRLAGAIQHRLLSARARLFVGSPRRSALSP
jgi:low temperature requirement protein LtrA